MADKWEIRAGIMNDLKNTDMEFEQIAHKYGVSYQMVLNANHGKSQWTGAYNSEFPIRPTLQTIHKDIENCIVEGWTDEQIMEKYGVELVKVLRLRIKILNKNNG